MLKKLAIVGGALSVPAFSFAAVPAAVTTAITAMQTDGVEIVTAVGVALFVIFAAAKVLSQARRG